MTARHPKWEIPRDLASLVAADADATWEDDRWDPIQLSVIGGTTYGGREIALAWQVEFDPEDKRLGPANVELQKAGLEPDGYGWAKLIEAVFARDHPASVAELRFGDTEASACVVWVESEPTCRTLVEVVWSLFGIEEGS